MSYLFIVSYMFKWEVGRSWASQSTVLTHIYGNYTVTDTTNFFSIYFFRATFDIHIPKFKTLLFDVKLNFSQWETFFYSLNKKLQAAKNWKGRFLAVFALNCMLKTGFIALIFLFVDKKKFRTVKNPRILFRIFDWNLKWFWLFKSHIFTCLKLTF